MLVGHPFIVFYNQTCGHEIQFPSFFLPRLQPLNVLPGVPLPQVLLRLWKHECKRVIADRFTTPADVVWLDGALARLVGEELGDEARALLDVGEDAYFVDFLRDAPEATGNGLVGVEQGRVCLQVCVCIWGCDCMCVSVGVCLL